MRDRDRHGEQFDNLCEVEIKAALAEVRAALAAQDQACSRFGKWIKGCQFEPRYDLAPPPVTDALFKVDTTVGGMRAVIEALIAKTYVHDICIRCGKIVRRNQTEK